MCYEERFYFTKLLKGYLRYNINIREIYSLGEYVESMFCKRNVEA